MTPILLAASAVAPMFIGQSESISAYYERDLVDASFAAIQLSANQKELQKINADFARSFRFKTINVKLKEPFKLRLESKVEDTAMLIITNGPTQLVSIPRARVKQRTDLTGKPGRRQTSLDFGLVTPALFRDLFDAKFIRIDRATGAAVFDLTYKPRLKDGTRHRIWIDTEKRYTIRREWYSQFGGRLQATFTYEKPISSKSVWFPTKVSVENADGKAAGATEYRSVVLNSGLADSLFEI
jgi:outer membrane lipoprotein-sorting protein